METIQPIKNVIKSRLSETYVVEKSRSLMLMKEVPFGLGELKVLDTYLSRINARDPNATTVRFSKEEYEDLMGIERMHPERLAKYVKSIMSKIVSVPDKNTFGGWEQYVLFDYSKCFQDDETGQWWIDLSCTSKAKKLFFNIENIGYIRYQLKNILPLTSKYSVLLYIYLLDNRFRSSWNITVNELREVIFRCSSDFYKNSFKDFNKDILKKAINEVNEKTDLLFSYSTIKAGRKIVKVQFDLVKDNVKLPEPEQYLIENLNGKQNEQLSLIDTVDDTKYKSQKLEFLAEACNNEFSEMQMQVILDLIVQLVPYGDYPDGGVDNERYRYLLHKYNELICQSEKNQEKGKPIKNRFSYLKKILESEIKKEKL